MHGHLVLYLFHPESRHSRRASPRATSQRLSRPPLPYADIQFMHIANMDKLDIRTMRKMGMRTDACAHISHFRIRDEPVTEKHSVRISYVYRYES